MFATNFKNVFMKKIVFLIFIFFLSCQKNQQEETPEKFHQTPAYLEIKVFNGQGENISLQVQSQIRITETDGTELKKEFGDESFRFEVSPPKFVDFSKNNAAFNLEKATKKQILFLGKQKKEITCEISRVERYFKGIIFSDGTLFNVVSRVEVEEIIFPRNPKDEHISAVLELVYENGQFSIKE